MMQTKTHLYIEYKIRGNFYVRKFLSRASYNFHIKKSKSFRYYSFDEGDKISFYKNKSMLTLTIHNSDGPSDYVTTHAIQRYVWHGTFLSEEEYWNK